MNTLVTVQDPACSEASAPTLRLPEGCPNRTRASAPTGATRWTSVPGIAAAAAIATAPVPVIAWCSCPMEKMRASMSMDSAATTLPSEAV